MVETFLLRQPSVIEARVYGVRSPISGYFIAADIVVEPDADTDAARRRVLAACREGLADYQVPRMLKVVDAIEVRASGKKG
jgi:acyl-coenzyme A synthetase/AMP-(fatty) acid ligase